MVKASCRWCQTGECWSHGGKGKASGGKGGWRWSQKTWRWSNCGQGQANGGEVGVWQTVQKNVGWAGKSSGKGHTGKSKTRLRDDGGKWCQKMSDNGVTSTLTCDKCDGRHPIERCPHFDKEREQHKDAFVNLGRKDDPRSMGSEGGNHTLRFGRIVRQPQDGSCLFHSLNYGLQGNGSAQSLRREIAAFLLSAPKLEVAGDTIENLVFWDSNATVADYAQHIASTGWGGGIEIAAFAFLKQVNVHVYESKCQGVRSSFTRIACFNSPHAVRTIHVLYQGGAHYDALIPLAT